MNFRRIVFIINFWLLSVQAKESYIANVIEVDWNVTTGNNLAMEWEVTRPARGISAMSGFIEFKEDINTHNATASVKIYYSTNGVSYMLTAFHYPEHVFTDLLDVVYKNYAMDASLECCENALYIEDKFVPPLTKRRIICNNCLLRSENLPSHLRLGYYKLIIEVKGEIGFALNILIEIEVE